MMYQELVSIDTMAVEEGTEMWSKYAIGESLKLNDGGTTGKYN